MTFQSSFKALQLVLASPTSFLTLTSLCLYHLQLPSVQPCQDLSCLTKSSLALTRNTREPLLGSSKTYSCQSYVQCTHFWFNFIQQKVARSQDTTVPWHQKCGLWTSGTISRIHKVETSPSQPLHYVHICTKDANAMVMPVWVFLTAGTNQALNHFILYHHSHKGKRGHFHLPLCFENTGRAIKFTESWPLHVFLVFSKRAKQDGSTGKSACCVSLEGHEKVKGDKRLLKVVLWLNTWAIAGAIPHTVIVIIIILYDETEYLSNHFCYTQKYDCLQEQGNRETICTRHFIILFFNLFFQSIFSHFICQSQFPLAPLHLSDHFYLEE